MEIRCRTQVGALQYPDLHEVQEFRFCPLKQTARSSRKVKAYQRARRLAQHFWSLKMTGILYWYVEKSVDVVVPLLPR